MGIDDKNLNDEHYAIGQRKDSEALKDKGTGQGTTFVPDWDEPFKKALHGVLIITGECHQSVDKAIQQIEGIFNIHSTSPSIRKVAAIRGDVRPGDLSAHEQ